MKTGDPELGPGVGNSGMKSDAPERGVSYWSKVTRISLEALLLPLGLL